LNECTVAAAGTKHIERFASRFLTPPGYNHRRSLFTKGDGRCTTDARRGASHKGNLALKRRHIIDPSVRAGGTAAADIAAKLIPQFMGTHRLLLSLPLAVPHEAVALDEMQMQLSRLTPAILISVGNTVARRRNLSRRFWFR